MIAITLNMSQIITQNLIINYSFNDHADKYKIYQYHIQQGLQLLFYYQFTDMEILPKCINGNNIAVQICVSDECTQPNPFICANCVNNECKQLHIGCIIAGWTNIENKIEQSKKPNHPDFIKLSSDVEQTIQKSIKYLQKQLQQFNFWKSTFGMSTDAINFFKAIQNNQEHKFTGKQVAQILKDIKTEKEIKKYNEATIKQQMKLVLKKMQKTQKMIREMYSVWDVPQLSLKIKQFQLENMNKRLTKLTEKPTNLELKVRKMEFSVIKWIFQSVHFNIIQRQYIQISFQTVHSISFQPVHFNMILAVIINQLISVYFNIIFRVSISISFRRNYQLNGLVYISISFQGVYFNIIAGSTFEYISDCKFEYISALKKFAQSLKNPNLKSLKTLTLYYPYILGYDSDLINRERLISQSLQSLSELQSVTIIAYDIKSLDGFKSLGRKLNIQREQGWCDRQIWKQ